MGNCAETETTSYCWKKCHKTRDGALIAQKILYEKKNIVGSVYKCKRCGFWHVGRPHLKDNPNVFWENILNMMH